MLPSHTVENYLKAIFLAQVALLPSEQLVPMGQLASASGRRAGHRHDDGQGAGGVGARPLRALCGRPADGGRREARGAGAAPAPADRALPGAGDGNELDGSARRGRAPRARRLGPADRAHRRDARPAVRRSARRSDSRTRRDAHPAGVRHAADLSARRRRHRAPRQRSGQRVPAIRRAPRSQAGTGRARRGTRRGRRQRAAARPGSRVHDRRARRLEGAGAGGTVPCS